ncbi:MAG: alpha-mannosidase [Anaerolineae bacterium]
MSHTVRWTPEKIAQRLALIESLVYRSRLPLPPFRYKALSSPLDAPPVGQEYDDSGWAEIAPSTYWSGWRQDFILRTTFRTPESNTRNPIFALHLPLGDMRDFSHPETLAYLDGQPYAAADRHHPEIVLPPAMCDGQPHRLALHGWTGGDIAADQHIKLYMRECAVVEIEPLVREFVAAARVTVEVASQLDDNDPVKGRLYNALDDAFKVLDTRGVEKGRVVGSAEFPDEIVGTTAFYDSVPEALRTLRQEVAAAGAPMDVDIIGVGHAHIDVAWLWTLGQVVRKSGRTFSTVLRLMEQYPDYTFSQSQAQLYQYVEQNYPELFAQIKRRVAEGRWEVMGGTWVEPDCNAIGAESLVRQFLLGRGYFRRHFGDVDTPVLWLPDTFGYSWALPQLIVQAGMKYFITHKMSWNQYNQMPHQLLWWQGLDGTRVLTHFLTTPTGDKFLPYSTTYNGMANAKEIFGTWNNFRQKETYNQLLTAYGYGDGGGGPTREMIENIAELEQFPGAPRVHYGSVREFMEGVEREVADGLPVWNGEFYLEYHRGTYTSQARNKRGNRKSEFLLHDAEFLAAWAALATDYEYPRDAFQQAWELVCLNQFHDILPGSSIGAVYEDSARDYAAIRQMGEAAREDALAALARTLPTGTSVMVANPTSFGGRRIGLLEGELRGGLVDVMGNPLAAQPVEGGTLVELRNLQPYSIVGLREVAAGSLPDVGAGVSVAQSDGQIVLENGLVRVELNAGGDITRVYDIEADRDVLAAGGVANALQAFEDRPMNYDAWDIDIFFEDRMEKVEGVERISIIEQGPLRAGVEIVRKYRSSSIVQRLYLTSDSKRLDFDTWIDWHEHHVLLKAAFPVEVMNPMATFDVQWGNVQRPTHRNTSWDWGRFETCAHKWADLSEGNYGVAVLNDCKYGYDVHDNVIRLSLLKSATNPDENADQGEHRMIYSLLPHTGDWRDEVIPAAYDLNDPLILRRVSGAASEAGASVLVSASAPNVVIETVKQAEDGDGIIVRLYEDQRSRGRFTLTTGFALAGAYRCNLLEENEAALDVHGNEIHLEIAPYQIISLRLIPQE